MPRTALTGGAPLYQGQQFSSENELLNEVKNLFTTAGQVVTDEIATNRRILCEGNDNGDKCWIEFKVKDDPGILDGKKLVIRGDLDGTGSSVSDDDIYVAKFTDDDSANNRLWLVADEGSFAIAIVGVGQVIVGYNGGFLKRHVATDVFAWGLFSLDLDYSKFVLARGFHADDDWHKLSQDYSLNIASPIQGLVDSAVICAGNLSNTSTSTGNSAYRFLDGGQVAVDNDPANNLIEFSERYFIEGRNSINFGYNSPGNNAPPELYFRGAMKFVTNGVAQAPGEAIVGNAQSGIVLSCGNLGVQGIVLVDSLLNSGTALTPQFLVGDSGFDGEIFTTEIGLLQTISSTLNAAGWTIYDDITASKIFVAEGTASNGDKCHLEFRTENDSYILDGRRLKIRGDLDNTKTEMSPDTLQLRFIEGAQNRLWLIYDNDSVVTVIKDFNGTEMMGIHGGFCDRVNPNNPFEWCVGYTDNSIQNSYVAKNPLDDTRIWDEVASSFVNTNYLSSSSNIAGTFEGVLDRYTVCLETDSYYRYKSDSFGRPRNAGLYAYNGSVNGVDAQAVYGSYFYRLGAGNPNGYGSANYPFYFARLGNIKYLAVGAASLPGGSTGTDTSGFTYLSTGNNQINETSQAGQGVRVA